MADGENTVTEMINANGGDSHDFQSLLSSEERDFLVRNNSDQVKISDLSGKTVGLYFSGSWCGPCCMFTPSLVEVYEEISSKGDFEVVFISSDKDDESFNKYFSEMPWLAIPFSDSETRKSLKELFKVRGIPYLVILDGTGKVVSNQGVKLIKEYGVDGYPFTAEKINFLKEQEEEAKKNQCLSSILVSSSRDYVISNDGTKVLVSELEGKMVGLYFAAHSHEPCHDYTPTLVEVYKKLKDKGENFEIVLISLDYEEESFKQGFESMPWLALPFSDKSCKKLIRYFELGSLPTLVIIGPDGKTLNPNVAELIEEHGIEAYPFTPEKLVELAEIEKARLETQTIESLLVFGERDFVIEKNGSKVLVSELEGKMVGLYFAAHSHKLCHDYTPKLVEVYKKLKDKGENFEIVLISLDYEEESFKQGFESMPWLALPFSDKSCKKLIRYFELGSLPTLVIIGPDGKTLNPNVAELIEEHGIEAYPFTPEKLVELAEIEKARLEAQTVESLLVLGERDFVIEKNGSKVPVSELIGKNILLYFSAHWCPPCRAFLPKLIEAHHEIKAKDNAFEVIFISSDHDQSSFDAFFSSMPWLALPFGDERKTFLSRKFKVEGIPTAIAIGPSGRTVTKEARQLITAHGADAYPFTEEHLKHLEHLEQQLEEEAKGWPEKVKHELHAEHELIRTQRKGYICNGCREMGHGWSFYCKQCDFGLHPKCALKDDTEKGKQGWVCDGDVCRKA